MLTTRDGITLTETLMDHVIFGAWIIFEKHNKEHCNCSYCRKFKEEGKAKSLWLPENKARNSWRVWVIEKEDGYYYYRWTLPEPSAFLGFELKAWGKKPNKQWRLRLGGFGMGKNSLKSFLTLTSHQFHKTKIPHVESLFWRNMLQHNTSSRTTGVSEGCCANLGRK